MIYSKNAKSIELLAPAGELSSGIVAIDNGADAIYCGLKKFSARDRAENFSFDDLAKVLCYAHERNKKVYIAFNTLVKDSELSEASKMIAKIAELRADGVIVQDLGIARIVREYFPSLRLHASTQLAIHNSAGANFAKRLGFSRVILERQLLLKEIEAIVQNSKIEIEIFVHGALCCSFSGQCLLSSWIGGYSGNRGKCKQACRFPSFTDKGKYPLSTRDLCMVDKIKDLKNTGISSFKIEGRLKALDYVANTVKAYRILLDAGTNEYEEALKEARKLLNFSSTRKYVSGFERDFNNLINPDEPGVVGIRCGKVVKVLSNGFYACIDGRLHSGDKLRVQRTDGSSAVSFTVKKILADGKVVSCVNRAEVFLECDREVRIGDLIFKIGESFSLRNSQLRKLKNIETEFIDLSVKIKLSGFKICIKNLCICWEYSYNFKTAQRRPLDEDTVKGVFSDTADQRFRVREIEVEIDGNYFIPLSELKDVRREFWRYVSEIYLKREQIRMQEIQTKLEKFERDFSNWEENFSQYIDITHKREETICGENAFFDDDKFIRAFEFEDRAKVFAGDEIILPYFCSENNLKTLIKEIDKLVHFGIRRFRTRSLAHFEILRQFKGLSITAGFPLQCANSMAFCEFRSFGADKVQLWGELEREEIENLIRKFSYSAEIFVEGFLPLLFTRGKLKGDTCEIMGDRFIVKDIGDGLKVLLSECKFKLTNFQRASVFRDIQCDYLKTQRESKFNFEREWK